MPCPPGDPDGAGGDPEGRTGGSRVPRAARLVAGLLVLPDPHGGVIMALMAVPVILAPALADAPTVAAGFAGLAAYLLAIQLPYGATTPPGAPVSRRGSPPGRVDVLLVTVGAAGLAAWVVALVRTLAGWIGPA